jgi:hypothetical protein
MNDTKPDPNEWGHDPISAEVNEQILAMPDRPSLLLAIITINKSPAEAKFRALGPFKDHFIRDLPYECFGHKVCASLFGFEPADHAAFSGTICFLSDMNIDEAVLYLDGVPSLRITKPKLKNPPSEFI